MRSRQFAENASAQELASRFEVKATGLEAELASACSHIQTLQESMKGAVGAEDVLRLSQQYEEARRLLEGEYRKAVESMQRDQAAERVLLEDRVIQEQRARGAVSNELAVVRKAHDTVVHQFDKAKRQNALISSEALRSHDELQRALGKAKAAEEEARAKAAETRRLLDQRATKNP